MLCDSKTKKSFFVVLPMAFLICSCSMVYDEDKMEMADGGIDFKSYAGLQIIGEKIYEDGTSEVGPLDMAELSVAIYTKCYDEMITPLENQYGAFCNKKEIAAEHPEDQCQADVCMQQLYNCMGYRFLEIADGVGIFELETEIFQYIAEMDEGEIYFDLKWRKEYYIRIPKGLSSAEPELFKFRIPPQTSENKTLALKAAYAAFREGAIRGGRVVSDGECIRRVSEYTGVGIGQIAADPDELDMIDGPSLMDFVVTGFKESQQMFMESTQYLVENETSVASAENSGSSNYILAQGKKWQGKVNSYGSALKHIAGRKADATDLPIGAFTKIDSSSQKRAIRFLRAGASESVLDFDIDDETVVKATLDELSKGDGGLMSGIGTQEYMRKSQFTLEDVRLARRYLEDEQESFQRVVTPKQNEEERSVYGLQTTKGHPGSYWLGRITGGKSVKFENYTQYARIGAVQALDFVAVSADSALKRIQSGDLVTTDQQAKILATTAMAARTLAGDKRVVAEFRRGPEGLDVGITLYGAKISIDGDVLDGKNAATEVILVRGHEGYRCVTEGSIDGAPCSPLNYIINTEQETIEEEWPRGSTDNGVFVQATGINEDEDLYVMMEDRSSNIIKQPTLVAKIKASIEETANDKIIVVPEGGGFKQIVSDLLVPDWADAGFPRLVCGDIPIVRGYVPPLENEITENSDPYENSWAHYLELAKSAAEEADRLGEELVNYGLQMDEIAENARRQIEDACGGVVSLPDDEIDLGLCDGNIDADCGVVKQYLSQNGSTCLPTEYGGSTERVDVSLGGPLCVFKWKKSKRMCYCPGEDSTQEEGKCAYECPIPARDNQSCEELYKAIKPGDWYIENLQSGEEERPEFVKVDNTLNLFETIERQVPHCHLLNQLRVLWNSPNRNEEAIEDKVEELFSKNGWWLNGQSVSQLNQSLRYDEDIFFHYTISMGGRELWTTKVEKKDECPLEYPWLPYSPSNNTRISCAPVDGYAEGTSRISTDLQNGHATIRRLWGETLRSKIKTLGYLTGRINNITTSMLFNPFPASTNICASLFDYGSFDLIGIGELDLPMLRNTTLDNCSGSGCECLLYNFLPAWVTNYPEMTAPCNIECAKFRYDCNADFNVKPGHARTVYNFWQYLPNLLKGKVSYSDISMMGWRMEAEAESMCGIESYSVTAKNCPHDFGYKDSCFLSEEKNTTGYISNMLGREAIFDILNFACRMIKKGGLGCEGFDPNSLPPMQDSDDILQLESKIKCAANEIDKKAGRLVIPNMPTAIVEGFRREGIESQYPGYGGKALEAILGIESALKDFSRAKANVTDILFQISGNVRNIYLKRELFDLQENLINLESMRNVVNSAIGAASGIFSGNIFAPLQGAVNIDMEQDIKGLKIEANEIEEEIYLNEQLQAIADHLSHLREQLDTINYVYTRIQTELSNLDQVQNNAMRAYADMLGLDVGLAGHVFPYNTAMRRRQNTVRVRYQNALKRAKKLAYIARRAIEFRLGIDMKRMEKDMMLVPAPQEWADRVCEMEGFDYQKIRDLDPEDDLLEEEDHYAHMYIGDYVKMLEDFVESYNMDYPFSDESDIAVISLREDIKRSKSECNVESYNRLIYSGEIGEYVDCEEGVCPGWHVGGCEESDCACITRTDNDDEESAFCDIGFCFGEIGLEGEDTPHKAERLQDTPSSCDATRCSRPEVFVNTGYFYQNVEDNYPGYYILSWYAELPRENGVAVDAVPYKVDVVTADENEEEIASTGPLVPGDGLDNTWERRKLRFELTETKPLQIRISPSYEDNSTEFGDVWIWGVQLEFVEPWRCEIYDGDCSEVEPFPLQETGNSRITSGEYCADEDGHAMRAKHFQRLCICENDTGVCAPGTEGSDLRHCFWQTTLKLNLEDIENGDIIPSHNIALHNYNYRHEALAVNLVGTDVRDCSQSESPNTCYSNVFVPYTLIHSGKVYVKNHTGDTVSFVMPTARVEYGKGLASESLITNPPSSTHSQLLGEYYKTGLRGRPLQGEYVLRIWDVPELNWNNVEDIQLIWKYRYWTRMSYGD